MTAPVPAHVDEQPLDAPVPQPVLPDRADAPVSEVAERFLRTVVADVPLALIEELHLFSPLRQGTVETGIAVLAARVPLALAAEPLADQQADDPQLPLAGDAQHVEAIEPGLPDALDGDDDDQDALPVIATAGDDDDDVSYLEELAADASADEGDEAEAVALEAAPATVRPVRHTVYTARYRYVIKGPERGKWESSIKAEADAPLITVETVVRGVQRRAGEDSEIVRYTAAQLAKALRLPFPE
ncbi:hypothetical protein [Gemmatimonas sp.]|uniref:hypothetical protein n=1 Tax=Gemmatimonas sp. TaxID=1962908 RepID=UPI0022BF1EF0|nr:hypothetical protein [Gemmatimonas sp.]MCZ8205172.1 hypothetical protein [Gemmatimonas sp.]